MPRLHLAPLGPALVCLIAPGLRAQAPLPPPDLQAENARIQELWKGKRYEEALKVLTLRAQSPTFSQLGAETRAGVHYNMACAASLLGRRGEALTYLGTAVGEGLKDWATFSTDSDLDSLRKEPGFLWLEAIVRQRGDFVGILRRFQDYGPTLASVATAAPAFTYQPQDAPDLVALRKACRLDEVAGSGSEFERIVNLMRWVHAQVRHDGSSKNPEPMNALHLLEVCRTEKRGINCRMMATILNEAYLALGFKSRQVTCQPLDETDPDCHVITTVWSRDLGKWLYMDPTMEAWFTDGQGHPLSIAEVRERLISGGPLELAKGANWNGRPENPATYKAYMAKNLVRITCPVESAYGYESRPERRYVTLDAAAFPPRPARDAAEGLIVHDPVAFWVRP
ncbi:transglutaminase-like domain-containing protein [Geothrix oryzisoli]|uniref:transglutaminase-like domain-containing protein n=1 Tax=Geothrix oryzisoli TaxID=2922721 RepID=UPI001FADBA27|nr:transglutaminase-like domain-containing protein [Geothrix oryzisoli]